MKRIYLYPLFAFLMLFTAFFQSVHAEQFKDVNIGVTKAGNGVYMLTGKGGNMAVSVGADGVFLVDDQFAPLSKKIRTAISTLSDKPVKFVINTHWHPDHTGGNENMGKSGSSIVAHDNVRRRLSKDNFIDMFSLDVPAMPAAGLPVITFNNTITFHFNDEEITALHVPNAHTDGDVIIVFKRANVIHTGDIYFAGMYPFIDAISGGTSKGTLTAIDRILAMANDKTTIIPGHGPISNKAELTVYRSMLDDVYNRILSLSRKYPSLEKIKAARPTAEYDKTYGEGMIGSEQFVEMLFNEINPGW